MAIKKCVATFGVAIIVSSIVMGCGDSADPNPNPPRTQQQQSGLSASFINQCARCHGETGQGQVVSGNNYPVIPGGKDESSFIAIVRAGRGDMPAFDASQITDADLKADYLWLTTKR